MATAGADTGARRQRGPRGGHGGCFRAAESTVEAGVGGAAVARTGSKSTWRGSAAGAWGLGEGTSAAWNGLQAQPWEAKKWDWNSAPTCSGGSGRDPELVGRSGRRPPAPPPPPRESRPSTGKRGGARTVGQVGRS